MADDPVCVYTALIGQHEALNEQPVAKGSSFRFICFTDNPAMHSDTWELRPASPMFELDPVRSQRSIKLQPHRWLPEFAASLYIDNSVILKEPPERILERYKPASGLALPLHSFRNTVLDEFAAVYAEGRDDPARVLEQLNHYALSESEALQQKPFWGAVQLRDHRNQAVRDVLDTWFAHVLRYSRRDQLSANHVMAELGFVPDAISIDNYSSWFHDWPVRIGQVADGPGHWMESLLQPAARLRMFQNDVGTLQTYLATLEAAVASFEPGAIEGTTMKERLVPLRRLVEDQRVRYRRRWVRRVLSAIVRRLSGTGQPPHPF